MLHVLQNQFYQTQYSPSETCTMVCMCTQGTEMLNNNKEMRFNFLTEIKCCLTGQSKYSVHLHLKKWRKQLRCPKMEKAALLLLLASYCLFENYIKPSSAVKVVALGVPGVCFSFLSFHFME